MDPLMFALILIAVVALSGWGYGSYTVRPRGAAGGTVVEEPAAWVNPLGIIGVVVVVGILLMMATSWHPFMPATVPGP